MLSDRYVAAELERLSHVAFGPGPRPNPNPDPNRNPMPNTTLTLTPAPGSAQMGRLEPDEEDGKGQPSLISHRRMGVAPPPAEDQEKESQGSGKG